MGESEKNNQKKKNKFQRFFEYQSVKLEPNLKGARVIEGSNGAEELVGTEFPWYRVHFRDSSVYLYNEDGDEIRHNEAALIVSIESRALARQAQSRHMINWAKHSSEPIRFVPKEDPVWANLLIYIIFVPAIIWCGVLSIQSIPGFSGWVPNTVQSIGWYVYVFGPSLLSIGLIWLLWIFRPRKQHFQEIHLLPNALVGILISGEQVSFEFEDCDRWKLIRRNPTRFKFQTLDGRKFSPPIPIPINRYLREALYPTTGSRADARRADSKKCFWIGIRIILVSICIIGMCYPLISWLVSQGLILPATAAHITPRLPFIVGMFGLFGVMHLHLAWKFSDHGTKFRSKIARKRKNRAKQKKNAERESSA